MGEIGKIEDRQTHDFQDRIPVRNHLGFLVQHRPAGTQRPGRCLTFLLADRTGRINDLVHRVDTIRPANG